MVKRNPSEILSGDELGQAAPNTKEYRRGFWSGLTLGIGGMALVAATSAFVAYVELQPKAEASHMRQVGEVDEKVPIGLINAATVSIEKYCKKDQGRMLESEATGGVYLIDGKFRIGTVAHAIHTSPDPLPMPICDVYVTVSGQKPTSFTLPQDAFVTSYIRPVPIRAAGDQPVFADVPDKYIKDMQEGIANGQLTPLEITADRPDKAIVYYRQNFVTSVQQPSSILLGRLSVSSADGLVIDYSMNVGNTCPGNSGSPLLAEDANGQPTNHAIGVFQTTMPDHDSKCGRIGNAAGFQV